MTPKYPHDPHLGELLLSADEIAGKVTELAESLGRDYRDKDPLLVAVLKGAFVFLGDLVRAVPIPVQVDFMDVSSYGSGTRTSGVVRILKDLDANIAGRHVVLVEDIVDSGSTLGYLRDTLRTRQPASLEVCSLLVRESNSEVNDTIAYVGFEVPDEFVVGYGLDLAERYRDLPAVYLYAK